MRGAPLAIANSFKSASLAFICIVEIGAPYLPDFLARYVIATLLPINERYPILLVLLAVLAAAFIAASIKEVRQVLKIILNALVTITAVAAPIAVLSRFMPVMAAVATTTIFYLVTGLAVGVLTPKRTEDRLA